MKKYLYIFITLFFFSFNASAKDDEIISVSILTGDTALKIAQGALKAASNEYRPIAVTVVDRSGQTLAMARHHDAGIDTINASYKKAFTANSMKKETADIAKGIAEGLIPSDVRNINNILVLDGGVPIIFKGRVIGGVGVSGTNGAEDIRFAKAGINAALKNAIIK